MQGEYAAVDWARGRGVYWTWDGQQVLWAENLLIMLDHDDFSQPARIVLEPAFESFGRTSRETFIEKARAAGHVLERIADRITPRVRRRMRETVWGDDCPVKGKATTKAAVRADDEYDCRSIWHAVRLGYNTSPVHAAAEIEQAHGTGWIARQAAANRAAVILRFTGQKTGWLVALNTAIGPASGLPDELRQVLADSTGKRYLAFVPSVWLAARHARDRAEFEKLLGLHQNGFASMLRSEVHHHGYRPLSKRGVTWRQYRRGLRWLYHRLRDLEPPVLVE